MYGMSWLIGCGDERQQEISQHGTLLFGSYLPLYST